MKNTNKKLDIYIGSNERYFMRIIEETPQFTPEQLKKAGEVIIATTPGHKEAEEAKK